MPFLVLVSLLWAFSFGLIKQFLGGVDSTLVAAVRVTLALAVFLPFLRLRAVSPATALRLTAIGAVQFGLMYLAYLAAFQSLHAYQVALLTIVTPIWVCVCDDILERRLRWASWAAAALAVLGAGIVIARTLPGRAEWYGVLLVQASNLCFASGQVFYRRWKQRQPEVRDRAVFAWLYLGAAAATVPFAAIRTGFSHLALSPAQFGVLAYLGVLASGIAFFLWNLGATRVTTAALAVMNNAKTPLGVAVSLLVFGEKIDLVRLLTGGALIVAAALWAQRASR